VDEALEVRVARLSLGPTVVAVTGELDLAGVPTVRTQVRELLSRGEPVVLDLGGTTFLDVAGVRLLVALSREAAAAETCFGVLPALAPALQLVLDLTGLAGRISFAGADPRPSVGSRPEPGSRP
jgi:anti-anti-sigma factor